MKRGGVAELPSLDYKKLPGGCSCSRLKASESLQFIRFLSLSVGLELASLERENPSVKSQIHTEQTRRTALGVRFGSVGPQIMLRFSSAKPHARLRLPGDSFMPWFAVFFFALNVAFMLLEHTHTRTAWKDGSFLAPPGGGERTTTPAFIQKKQEVTESLLSASLQILTQKYYNNRGGCANQNNSSYISSLLS